ncbi:YrhA family protein [Vibrio sp. V39_P1S14PM300]|uniref:YrhA family protein n=1 Tax=Vibrio sp. V39_P1S14PM300 TaxID=1938690 RepID=UPI00137313AA|nr:YrhA family protein [Vibrio sp. V39_P1S14PM300]NAX20987.1 hypothetical protein [Vibrio sp. V39_P1S14PM300]
MTFKEVLQALIHQHNEDESTFGAGFFLDSATSIELETLRDKVQEQFNVTLPDEYLEILKLTNGFSLNGLSLYGSVQKQEPYFLDGVIDANKAFWDEETLREYFAFSEESTTRLVFSVVQDKYLVVDRVTWDTIEEFDTFGDALSFQIDDCCILSV